MKQPKRDLVFEAEQDGGLLECVQASLTSLPRSKLKSYLSHRLISVDGVVTSQFDHPVKAGQTVRIYLSGEQLAPSPLEILYEDEELLAVNKPAGLLSVASDSEKEKTAIRLMRDSGYTPLYVVHRLDRDTSGLLLFAKSMEMRDKLQENWDTVIRREYLAICEGVFEEKRGRCDSILRETSTHLVYSAQSGPGKRAITNYEVLRENRRYSFLRILIETGRKNQIRVHMKDLYHPVVGDKKYGAHGSPLGRLGLHASRLVLPHPRTGETLELSAPPDSKFRLPKENS